MAGLKRAALVGFYRSATRSARRAQGVHWGRACERIESAISERQRPAKDPHGAHPRLGGLTTSSARRLAVDQRGRAQQSDNFLGHFAGRWSDVDN